MYRSLGALKEVDSGLVGARILEAHHQHITTTVLYVLGLYHKGQRDHIQ